MDHEEEERARMLDSSGSIVGRHSECAGGSVLRRSGGSEAAAYAHSTQYRGTLAVMLLLVLCAGATVLLQKPGRHWADDGALTRVATTPSARTPGPRPPPGTIHTRSPQRTAPPHKAAARAPALSCTDTRSAQRTPAPRKAAAPHEAGLRASAPDSAAPERPRAAFLVLARNEDLDGVLSSMSRLERRLNNTQTRYPWIFLDDKPLDEKFRAATAATTGAPTQYGLVPREQWSYPPWVTPAAAAAARKRQAMNRVWRGDRESYHFMCRYFSGFFQHHPLLAEFDYFWRIEPEVDFSCNLTADPFVQMQQRGIKYGFTLAVGEARNTVPTLWNQTRAFMAAHPKLVPKPSSWSSKGVDSMRAWFQYRLLRSSAAKDVPTANLLDFVTMNGGVRYDLCHFWSNFELGDLRWFRSAAYQAYFDHLDKAGGFFLERWGDAPMHTLAAAMLLNVSEVHFFSEIGYQHGNLLNCPAAHNDRCQCDPKKSLNNAAFGKGLGRCHVRWRQVVNKLKTGA